MSFTVTEVKTTPFEGQKPGTSGLRKRVKVFQQPHYTENFIQAILDAIPGGAEGSTLVVGGDGRYFGQEAVQIIIKLSAANKVCKLIIGQSGILSTPAASNLIIKRKATGGILLTASHNPGGPENDFGIKYNMSNGGPAPEGVTDKIYEYTVKLASYKSADIPEVDLSKLGITTFPPSFEIEIVDSVHDYVILMKEIFDFSLLKSFFSSNPKFKVLFDSMHGVTGPYNRRILVEELGLPESSSINTVPLLDFGGGHPDPNLTYAHELVEHVEAGKIDFGAASDGDGDRNMIIGYKAFVNPSDSVAVIAARAHVIPYFVKSGVKGLARSMPTSAAIDRYYYTSQRLVFAAAGDLSLIHLPPSSYRVGKKMGVTVYEVPTGWKFFGNLMDAGKLSICGEESFGTGSDHIREKDGVWAILAWLSIVADANSKKPGSTLNDILNEHYSEYGRNYFSRYDYEEVSSEGANTLMGLLRKMASSKSLVGQTYRGYTVADCDDFAYTDPVDGSVSTKQGIRVIFSDDSRIIYRLSGTGSSGATIRIYFERYSSTETGLETSVAVGELVKVALEISKLEEFTGRTTPTVIT
ncbi:phosphoglucosamine mutase [Synchytrium microbalum]|uniref:phosphoglucomutase (alpha-D-glucose-1,6-bisphosphate-dependent) n=1 Tax=Synchytrium microbalum TaxID=1806994 RepID=A0A507C3W0_9FUNG|nr:phosphoglucosamine mutase [Synchytrium microbalum]TPX33769.1 phosphoglucosamine mutase [Synchytrium microbalum]